VNSIQNETKGFEFFWESAPRMEIRRFVRKYHGTVVRFGLAPKSRQANGNANSTGTANGTTKGNANGNLQ